MPDTLDLSKFQDLQSAPTPTGADTLDLSKFRTLDQAQQKPQTFWDKLGGWRGLGATGIRALSGVLSAEGGIPGAAISGAGETAAEALEQGTLTPKVNAARVALESGIGAIPFGEIVKGGRLATSALRSGTLGAVGEAGRELTEGQDVSPTSVLTSGGLGALLGAGGAKFMGRARAGVKPTPITAGMSDVAPQTAAAIEAAHPLPPPSTMKQGGVQMPAPRINPKIQAALEQTFGPEGDPYSRVSPVQGKPADIPKMMTAMEETDIKNAAAADKAAQQAADNQRIQEEIASRGLVRQPPSIRQSTKGAEGLSMTETFKAPEEEGEEDLGKAIGKLGVGPAAETKTPTGVQVTPPTPTPVATTTTKGAGEAIQPTPKRGRGPKAPISQQINDIVDWAEQKAPTGQAPEVSTATTPAPESSIVETPSAPNIETAAGSTPELPESWQKFAGVQPPEQAPQSELAKFFRTPAGAAGYNYRLAKNALGAGEIPTSKYAKEALLRENEAARLRNLGPSAPVEGSSVAGADVVQPGGGAGAPTSGVSTEAPDWVKEQLSIVDRLRALKEQESGGINPALLTKLFSPVAGAAVGAPVGAYYNPDDPLGGALKGAAAGGVLGFAGAQGALNARPGETAATAGLKELVTWRNAGLLSGWAQAKKPLSDLGAVVGKGMESLISGDTRTAAGIGRELFRAPSNLREYLSGLRHPEVAVNVLGDAAKAAEEQQGGGALGLVGRPFSAAQNMTAKILERAGVPSDEIERILFLGDPESSSGGWWVEGQKNPVIRALRPFQRIATNIVERGVQRTPGVNTIARLLGGPDNPETRLARNILGTGAMSVGAAVGARDKASADEGDPTNPVIKGLRRALMASYGLPFSVGEAVGGQDPREIYYMIPGLSQTVPPPAPNDTMSDWMRKIGSRFLEQIEPAALSPDTGSAR